jgi:hypothetical protein
MLCSRVERKDAEQDAGSLAVEVKNKYHSSRGKPFTLLCFALLCFDVDGFIYLKFT